MSGQGIHQVEIEGPETTGRLFKRRARLRGIVHPADNSQRGIVEALHTNRQTRDARLCKSGKPLLLKCSRIGFQRDFTGGQQGQPGPNRREQLGNGIRTEQTGRSATKKYTVNRPAPDQRQRSFQICQQGAQIFLFWRSICGALQTVRIEIAVRTLLQAPGQVDVERQRRQGLQLQQPRSQVMVDGCYPLPASPSFHGRDHAVWVATPVSHWLRNNAASVRAAWPR